MPTGANHTTPAKRPVRSRRNILRQLRCRLLACSPRACRELLDIVRGAADEAARIECRCVGAPDLFVNVDDARRDLHDRVLFEEIFVRDQCVFEHVADGGEVGDCTEGLTVC